MLAASAQSPAELKAYYEKQKVEIAKNFTGPELKSEITVVLKNGEGKTGVLRQLSDNGVQLLAGGTLVTYRKRHLNEATCAQLFAEEYAHAEAIRRTRAYKRGHTKRVQDTAHKGSLSVRSKVKETRDQKTEVKEIEEGTWNIETKDFTRVQNLKVTVVNRTSHPDTYSLEWYFFVKDKKGSRVTIHSKGSKEITLKGRQKGTHEVASKEYASQKLARGWVACCGMSADYEDVTGVDVEGYLVVLKCGNEVLARDASAKRYLDPDWILLCK